MVLRRLVNYVRAHRQRTPMIVVVKFREGGGERGKGKKKTNRTRRIRMI